MLSSNDADEASHADSEYDREIADHIDENRKLYQKAMRDGDLNAAARARVEIRRGLELRGRAKGQLPADRDTDASAGEASPDDRRKLRSMTDSQLAERRTSLLAVLGLQAVPLPPAFEMELDDAEEAIEVVTGSEAVQT